VSERGRAACTSFVLRPQMEYFGLWVVSFPSLFILRTRFFSNLANRGKHARDGGDGGVAFAKRGVACLPLLSARLTADAFLGRRRPRSSSLSRSSKVHFEGNKSERYMLTKARRKSSSLPPFFP